MVGGSDTHDTARVTNGKQEHATRINEASLSSRVEAAGRELARYGLVVKIGRAHV